MPEKRTLDERTRLAFLRILATELARVSGEGGAEYEITAVARYDGWRIEIREDLDHYRVLLVPPKGENTR